MSLSLCMIVRNEEHRLPSSLGPIHDVFEQVLVLDDNSTDQTVTLLRDTWGIDPMPGGPRANRCKADLRNVLLEQVRTPWVVSLDADEQLPPAAVAALVQELRATKADGLFLGWDTLLGSTWVEDYKLAVFRADARFRGLAHETVQPDFRARGWHAQWSNGCRLHHHPDPDTLPAKRLLYRQRLGDAIGREPHWTRHHWFLGYSLHQHGDLVAAEPLLATAAGGHALFPVEALNARMVLASLYASTGRAALASQTIHDSLRLHQTLSEDFELAVNTRIGPWFQQALVQLREQPEQPLVPYAFAY